MNILSYVLIASIPFMLSKEERTFNKLNKQYQLNAKKGYDMSNKMLEKDNLLASPYFFKSRYFMEYSKTRKTIESRSNFLSASVLSALHFEVKAGESIKTLADFDEHKRILSSEVKSCIDELIKYRKKSHFKKLTERIHRLNPSIHFESYESICD